MPRHTYDRDHPRPHRPSELQIQGWRLREDHEQSSADTRDPKDATR